jgi:hypothetical protein
MVVAVRSNRNIPAKKTSVLRGQYVFRKQRDRLRSSERQNIGYLCLNFNIFK